MADPSERIRQLRIDRDAPTPSPRSPRPWWLYVAAAAVLLVSAGVALLTTRGNAVRVETAVVQPPRSSAAAGSVLDASGYVVARRQTTVSSEVTGKVREILIEEGMRVEAGDVVATLEDDTEQARLALARAQVSAARAALNETRAQLANAERELERVRDLAGRNLASQSSLDAAVARHDELVARLDTGRENVTVAERNVELALDALADTTIRAPFSGMIVSKNAQPGEMISPVSAGGGFTRTGICTIVDTDSLEIEVDVNEAYIQRVQPGQRVSATLDAYPDWQIPAEVIAIVPTADRQQATVKVRIDFLERDDRVLRDMGVKVAFLGSEVPAGADEPVAGVLVPGESIRSDASGEFVWLVRNGTVERRSVTLGGPDDRAMVLVADGVAAGDRVVTSASAPLSAGQAIEFD